MKLLESENTESEVKSVFDPNGKDLEEFRTHQRRVQVMQEPGELTVIRLSEIFWEFRRLQV